jgi:hypothetical protein
VDLDALEGERTHWRGCSCSWPSTSELRSGWRWMRRQTDSNVREPRLEGPHHGREHHAQHTDEEAGRGIYQQFMDAWRQGSGMRWRPCSPMTAT